MNWISSLFSSSSSSNRKGQALSSTHEAFSIPTSSPMFSSPYNSDIPEPDTATSASYTYPPQGSPYGYVPTSGGMPSILPLHHDPLRGPFSPRSAYPPLSSTWTRLRNWLAREYPELGDTLNYGILPQDLAQIESEFGFSLPAAVRESYLLVDGQEAESAAGCSEGLFFGLTLLPLEDVLEEWKFWRKVDEDPSTAGNPEFQDAMQSIPPGWVRRDYSQRGWIPLIGDKAGNYIGVDVNPGEKGAVGQVIVFGREFDSKVVLFNGDGAAGWAKWLASFVEDLESGEGFEIGAGNDDEGSEDDVGYESYFYDGSGRGQGDGGGDSGSGGGLRLTGEYRGWNVLEAWADRSVRKWYETGVISAPDEDVKPKGPVIILDLPQESSAEVPIPVFGEESSAASPSQNIPEPSHIPNGKRKGPPPNLPSIAVTKAPAPLPVELPTPRDIGDPSSPDSPNSFEDDLESGRSSHSMREMLPEASPSPVSRRSTENAHASSSNPATPTALSYPSSAQEAVDHMAPEEPVDLLVDTGPALETMPIEPASMSSTASPPLVDSESVTQDPDTTIRLVGGGGLAGLVSEEQEVVEPEEDQDSEVASLSSATSESSVTNVEGEKKKHKKTKSGLGGLKKLAGLRKKDSVSSVKDADSKQ
ncbi:hypothetical protein C8J56DRAFT_866732 [Mycena floridula]|nr:hypothetical protein C8J56DRAFT_866732 [Mycena floridula]